MVKNIFKILILAFLVTAGGSLAIKNTQTVQAAGNTYYVSQSGSDSNSCASAQSTTQSNDKLTIAAGVSCLSAGDTLYIRAGTYVDGAHITSIPSGTSSSNVTTISAYNGENVIYRPYTCGIEFDSGVDQYVTFNGFTIDGNNCFGDSQGIYFRAGSNHITIQNMQIMNWNYGNGILMGGNLGNGLAHDLIITNCNIYNNGALVDDSTPGLAGAGYAIYGSSNDSIYQNSKFHDNYGDGFQIQDADPGGTANRNIIRNNEVYNNGKSGHYQFGIVVDGSDNQIYNNIIHDHLDDGIQIGYNPDSSRNLVYNNTLYNNAAGIDIGIFSGVAGNNVIKNNIIMNSGVGVYVAREGSGNAQNTIIQNNIFYGNSQDVVQGSGATGSVVSGNIFQNPLLVNPGAGNYQLSSNSPAVNAGATVPEVTSDYVGVSRPQGSAYDIGAYEYPSGNTSTSPVVSLSSSSLSFGTVTVGSTSSVQYVTVSNTGSATFNFSNIVFAGDYAPAGLGTCGVSIPIAAGSSCTISIKFTPSTTGTRSGSITLTGNASPSTQIVSLTGTGSNTSPIVSLSSSSLSFGSIAVGASSSVQYLTVSNTGSATFNFSNIVFAGDFAPAGVGTCGVSIPISAGSSCTISIKFTPTATGTRSGSITLTDNASPSTQVITLSGVGASALAGDLNTDHIINSLDWSIMNSKWFSTDANADLNHDGLVNAIDFSILNANWFKTW